MIEILLVDSPLLLEYARRIRHKVFVEEQNVPSEIDLKDDSKALHFLAKKEGMYVATARYRALEPCLKFERLATLPEARGKGVATDLMLFMQALGAEEYPDLVPIIHAQTRVLLFYKRLGWIPIGDTFDRAGRPHQLMFRPPKDPAVLKKALKHPNCPKELHALKLD